MKARRIASYLLIAFLVLMALLPLLISKTAQYVVVDELARRGAVDITIESFWLNPYKGLVEISELNFSSNGSDYELEVLSLEVSIQKLIKRKIWVHGIAVSGIDVTLKQKPNGSLLFNGLDFSSPQVQDAAITDINNEAEEEDAYVWHFALDSLELSDVRINVSMREFELTAVLEYLALKDIDTDGVIKKSADVEIKLAVKELVLPSADINASWQLRYEGEIDTKGLLAKQLNVSALSMLEFTHLLVANQKFSVAIPNMHLNLNTKLSIGEAPSYQSSFDVIAKDLAISQQLQQVDIIHFQELRLAAKLNSKTVTVDNFILTGIEAFGEDSQVSPMLLKDGDLSVLGASVVLPTDSQAVSVVVEEINLSSLSVALLKNKQGIMPQLDRINELLVSNSKINDGETLPAQENASSEEYAATTEQKVNQTEIIVKRIVFGNDVAVSFSDQSIRPALNEKITVKQWLVENLNIYNVEQMANIDVQLGLSHNASVITKGKFNLASDRVDVSLSIKDYQVLNVSGYAEDATGYSLESGKFNIDSTIGINKNILKTKNDIFIDKLDLRAASAEEIEAFSQTLSMPLDQALDLLRDDNNHINLDVPVDGPLNDPNIDVQKIINKALGSAMKKASLLVLQSLLQPYGALISIVQYAGEEATKVNLDPITFVAGSNTLSENATDYAAKVAGLINKRESLAIKLCASTNTGDLTALNAAVAVADLNVPDSTEINAVSIVDLTAMYSDQLHELAQQRAQALKQYFIDAQQVDIKQLRLCLPKHRADGLAGVELSI